MEIIDLNEIPNTEGDRNFTKRINYFKKLISELRKKDISSEFIQIINQDIDRVNTFSGTNKALKKQLRKAQYNIYKLIEKELKITPKNFYRTRWLAIGMAGLGIPFGVVFGTVLQNMAFLGLGIPIGMVIGIVIGAGMDKKAFEDGRQLEIEMNV